MTAQIVQIRDYHLKRLEIKAAEIVGKLSAPLDQLYDQDRPRGGLNQVIDYREVARLGGPGGIDDLVFADTAPCEYVAPEADPA